MCEVNVYIKKGAKETLVLKDVDVVKPDGAKVVISNIFGEQKIIKARIKEVNLANHKIVLE
ncbi:MAG: CooT family nickel-binding protein [Planctomycetes bacterium]|nr:CooT family nickel-binding protein [Planctomycetota bacterium]